MMTDAQKTAEQRKCESAAERMRIALATKPLHRQGQTDERTDEMPEFMRKVFGGFDTTKGTRT